MIKRFKRFIHAFAERVKNIRVKRPTLKQVTQFVVKTAKGIYTAIFDFIKGCVTHFETIIIIILATIGLTALLGEIALLATMSLPFWLEVDMILPVVSASIIWLLIRILKWRKNLNDGGPVIA